MLKVTALFKSMRHGIARKFIFHLLWFTTLLTLFTTAFQLYGDYSAGVDAIKDHMNIIKTSYLPSIITSLWVIDMEHLNVQLEGIRHLPDIQYLEIVKDNKILASSGTLQTQNPIQDKFSLIYHPYKNGVNLGTLHVTASLEGVYQRLTDRFFVILGVKTVKSFLLATFLFILFHLLIGKHLYSVAKYAQNYDIERLDAPLTLNRRYKTHKKDDLDHLVLSINKMCYNLNNSFQNIQKYSEELQQEVKDRKYAEEQLSIFKRFTDASGQGMAMSTLEGQITYINPTLSRIFGEKNPDNVIGQSLIPYYDEMIRTRLVNEIIPTVILEGQWTGELEILTRTGDKTSTIENFFLIRDTNGKPLYLADVVTDITDRKKAREALEYSEAKNTALFNAIPDMMFQLAKDGTFLDFKSGKNIQLSMPHDDFLGKNVAEVLPPGEAQQILVNMDKAFQTREIQRFEYQISLEDNIYNYEARIVVLGDLEALTIIRDITERKLVEDQLKERQQEIESLNSQLEQRVQEELAKSRQKDHILIQQSRMASLGEMIGHIAHQWRQPLNALNLLLANIQQTWLFNELNDQFLDSTMIKGKQYIKKMSTTIDDFRNFFRPDKEKEEFTLSQVVNDTLSLVESTLNYYNINVKLKKDEDIKIAGFPNEYSQVIINLLSNSKDAIVENNIKNGEIRIEILNDENQAIVRLLDNGGGIPESMIEKVFDPYFSTKDEGKGTGIGLYMSKMIIEDHMEGRITARNVNGGVEFSIMTPKILAF